MSRLYNILDTIAQWIVDQKYTATALTSSNWTADKATFTSGEIRTYGGVSNIKLTLKLTNASTANTEIVLGSLKNLPVNLSESAVSSSVRCPVTISSVTGGWRVSYAAPVAHGAGTNLYVRIIWVHD